MAEEELTLEYLKRKGTVLRRVLDSIFDGVYITDRRRRILFWNRGAETITGHRAAEVAGHCCSDDILNHIDEDGRLLCRSHCPLAHAMHTGSDVEAKIYPLHVSGKRLPVVTHVAPLRDKDGNVIAAIEVFRDVSKEEELRIAQEKLNRLVQRYVSHAAYDEIQAVSRNEGEDDVRERDVTVLRMSLVGLDLRSENESPQEVVRLLNDMLGMCEVIIREKQGDLGQFMGDALAAVFIGADDAVEAAEKVRQEALPNFNHLRHDKGLDLIRLRMGIHSGIALQGDVGVAGRNDPTLIGGAAATAQRVERACEPGDLLASEATLARLGDTLADRFVPQGEIEIEGEPEPLRLFALEP